ncbi:8-amino-7-oxononanoate synthase [Vicingaceae bacterium]|nr:8-amino-7-oxononanoate synthase [Vicingaceae bacterium]
MNTSKTRVDRKALDWIDDELEQLASNDMLRRLACRESPPVGGQVQIDGQQYVNFGSNDYLGLAADTRLVEAVRFHANKLGWGTGASALISGHAVLHRKLEHEIAQFEETESAVLFSSGYAANVGTIGTLVGKGDAIFSDSRNHASIIDGCRLSNADIFVYRHRDTKHLKELLRAHSTQRRTLIVTDSLFSMDGDIAPLNEIADLADNFGAMLMVDEAHATGVFGSNGSGICELLNCKNRVDVRVGTLSKALGSIGGFVAGEKKLIDWIVNKARTYIFSTAQPDAINAASLASLEIVRDEPGRREGLLQMSAYVREQLSLQGWNIGDSASQIIPVIIGSAERALAIGGKLREQGLFAPVIRPPAVRHDHSLLRISLSSANSELHCDQLLSALNKLRVLE